MDSAVEGVDEFNSLTSRLIGLVEEEALSFRFASRVLALGGSKEVKVNPEKGEAKGEEVWTPREILVDFVLTCF